MLQDRNLSFYALRVMCTECLTARELHWSTQELIGLLCPWQVGREYLKELRENRFNPFWHKDPPANSCPMPPDNLPWRPIDEMW